MALFSFTNVEPMWERSACPRLETSEHIKKVSFSAGKLEKPLPNMSTECTEPKESEDEL